MALTGKESKEKKMISIIVPVYNTEKYIGRCIESVLNSTYDEFELILINDGSDDGSAEICKEHSERDPRIKYYEQQNQGVSAARNRGIEECKGEWIVFVDSDDYITCDFLSMVAKTEYQHYDLLLFDYIRLKEPGGSIEASSDFDCLGIHHYGKRDRIFLIEKVLNSEQLVENGSVKLRSPWAKAFKKSLIMENHIRFPFSIKLGEDTVFNIEYLQKVNSCLYMQKQVYFYMIRMDSAMRSCKVDLVENNIMFCKQLKDNLKKYAIIEQVKKSYYNNVLFTMADLLIKNIFNPYDTKSLAEKYYLCRKMHENNMYLDALNYNRKLGGLPRRVLLFFFRIKCYRIVKVICVICYKILEKKDCLYL